MQVPQKAINSKDLIEKLNRGNIVIPENFPFPCPIEGCDVLIYNETGFISHLFHDGGHSFPLNEVMEVVQRFNPNLKNVKGGE